MPAHLDHCNSFLASFCLSSSSWKRFNPPQMWFYPSLSWLQNFWLYMAYSIKSKISTRRPIHLPNFFIHYSHIKLHYKKLAGRDGNADWILTLSLTIILQADKTDSIQPWQRKRAYSPYNTAKLACSSPTCTSTPLHLCFTHYKASHLSVLLLLWILSSFLNWNSCLNIENLLYSYDLFIWSPTSGGQVWSTY